MGFVTVAILNFCNSVSNSLRNSAHMNDSDGIIL